MPRLIAAEAYKLRSTRTSAGLALAALVVVVLISAAAALTATATDGDPGRQAFSAPGVVQVFALLLGILAVTADFRHGTITPTLLLTPDRGRVLGAKLVAAVSAGLALGLVAYGLGVAIVLTGLDSRDVATTLDAADVLVIVAGGTLGAGLFAALGVGLGAVVRNQVGAIIGALVWLYVLEQLLAVIPGLGDGVRRFGLTGLSSGLSSTASPDPGVELLGPLPAGLLLATCVAVVIAAGAALLNGRDVTR